jgi:hypothetical protein
MNIKRLTINYLGTGSIQIDNRELSFVYNQPDQFVKDEFKGKYINFGGLQCKYKNGTQEYEELYSYLLDLAETIIKKIEE